jgi:hypothetical protein
MERLRAAVDRAVIMKRSILVVALVAAALAPGSASAATTIGSDLTRSSSTAGYCVGDGPGAPCTILQLTLGTVDQAVPADGVITGWAVRDAGGDIALKVLDGAAGQRRVVASEPVTTVTGSGIQRFGAQISVVAGQRVGLELADAAHVPFVYRDEVTTGEQYLPPVGAEPVAPYPEAALSRTYEILFSVTIEPDRDRDGLGDETQGPDHGGLRPCPTSTVLARGDGTSVTRSASNRVVACRAGVRTTLGTVGKRTKLRLFQFNGDWLAAVRVSEGRSTIQVFDLATQRRSFQTPRTSTRAVSDPTAWTVTDLVVAPNGDAAWIARPRGQADQTTVWIRHAARVQAIDTGRIRPTSLTLADAATGIYYLGADGRQRNSSFG